MGCDPCNLEAGGKSRYIIFVKVKLKVGKTRHIVEFESDCISTTTSSASTLATTTDHHTKDGGGRKRNYSLGGTEK